MIPRDKTLEIAPAPNRCEGCREGYHIGESPNDPCSWCGSTSRYPTRVCRRSRPIGGKRGRNSGTTGTAKNKKS